MNDSMTALDWRDEQTYDLLFKKLYKPLCFFALKIIYDKDKAEDIVQDCLLKLWLKKDDFVKFEKVQSYLYLSVKNACIDNLEHQKVVLKHEVYLQHQPYHEEYNALDLIVHAEILRKVANAIDTLPIKCKRVIQLTYNEGKSPKDIADELGVTVSTVTNQKLRGIAILKQRLCEPEYIIFISFLVS